MFLSDEGPTLKTLDFTAFYIGSTSTFLYFVFYFNIAYAGHYVGYSKRLSHFVTDWEHVMSSSIGIFMVVMLPLPAGDM